MVGNSNKKAYILLNILKTVSISLIIANVLDYVNYMDHVLYFLIFFVCTIFIFRAYSKKTKQRFDRLSEDSKELIPIIDKTRLTKYNWLLIGLIILLLFYKFGFIHSYEQKKICNNVLLLTKIEYNDTVIKPDSLLYHFTIPKQNSRYTEIDATKGERFEPNNVRVKYVCRPFSKLYIYTLGINNIKVNGEFSNSLDFGYYKVTIIDTEIVLQKKGKKFVFKQIKPSA